jgi:hypothetical protein
MSEPLKPELEQKAQELAARIRSRSEASILEMARRLVATTEETLFGETEFALRDQAVGLVADAYNEYLEKKADTSPPPSTARTAAGRPSSKTTAKRRSKASAGRSPAVGPITIAASAGKASAPGTPRSDSPPIG